MRDDHFGPSRPLKIAVCGTGISGMASAWLLSEGHDVTVFEKNNRIGGHTNTVIAETRKGAVPVDTGFIVYNTVNYPNLVALFDHLKVPTKDSDMSFAVSLDEGRLEYAGTDLNGLFAQRSNILRPRFWSMLKDLLRFYKEAPKLLTAPQAETLSLKEFLDAGNYGEAMITDHLLPMGAAIWSTPADKMLDFPALAFVRFCESHGLLKVNDRPQWRTVDGGSTEYVKRLTACYRSRIKLGAGVTAVRRIANGVMVKDASGAEDCFDHIVFASHADETLSVLKDADEQELKILGAFDYEKNTAILHADPSLMPRRKTVWSSWNYMGNRQGDISKRLGLSYWMNKLQSIDDSIPLFVTLNPEIAPRDDKIYHTIDYTHPIFDAKAITAQKQLWSLQGRNRAWFAGAYFGYGFHEDGLQSGLAVAEQLGGRPRPWTVDNPSGRITVSKPAGAIV